MKNCRRSPRLPALAGLAILLLATLPQAWAHAGAEPHAHAGAIEALRAGAAHPLTGFDHLLAMLTLGIWSGLASRRPWQAPLAFALVLAMGAALGLCGVALPGVEPMIAASLMVFGLLVGCRTALPAPCAAGVAGAFALFHGLAHGQEFAAGFPAWTLAGMVLSTLLLHGLGIAAGRAMRAMHPTWHRGAGAAVAVSGMALMVPAAWVGLT